MSSWSLSPRSILLPLFFGGTLAAGHDLSASYATIRFTPDALELEVKIAADAAWPVVQQKEAPGIVFVMEDFEKIGRPLLLTFARAMEDLSVAGSRVAPRTTTVAVVEDNFIFTFTYPRPARDAVVLRENYLKRMPSDYVSRVVVVNQKDEPVSFKTLHGEDIVFDVAPPTAASAEIKREKPIPAKP